MGKENTMSRRGFMGAVTATLGSIGFAACATFAAARSLLKTGWCSWITRNPDSVSSLGYSALRLSSRLISSASLSEASRLTK